MASISGKQRTARRVRRRTLLGGAAAASFTGAAGILYKAAPGFWQQMAQDLRRPILPAPKKPDFSTWTDRGLHAAWLGQSTVLVRADGFTVLTDPVLFDRVGIDFRVATLGIKRFIAPPVVMEELPPIDLVLLSHAHFDHFDLPTLRALAGPKTQVVTAPRTSDLLDVSQWAAVHEIGWNQKVRVGPASIRGLEVRHWGARIRTDTFRGYNGYLLEVGKHRVLFGGDTAWTDSFRQVRSSKRVDLALMPIGAYNPYIRNHCTPEQSWKMAADAGADRFLPIHHQTFPLGREPRLEPLERLFDAAASGRDRIVLTEIGGEFRAA